MQETAFSGLFERLDAGRGAISRERLLIGTIEAITAGEGGA